MTLNFSLWELGIFLIGIAFIIGSVYLVKLFKSLALTLDTTTKLMEDNRLVLRSIITNADEITKSSANVVDKASLMINEVEQSVSTIRQDVIDPLVSTITTLANLLSRLKSFDFKNRKKQSKIYRPL